MVNYQKLIKYLLSFVIAISPIILINNANAAGMGGWSLSNPLAQGASTAYSAAKNVIINGKNVVKTSTALITPTASQVAKLLGKGVAGVALSVAIQEMLGAVDWVMDADNNQIKYNSVGKKAVWMVSGKIYEDMTIQQACTAAFSLEKKIFLKYDSSYCYAGYIQDKNETITAKWAYAETTIDVKDDEQKTIPLDAVAQQIISKASAGDKTAQTATTATAADIVNEAEKDDAKARPIVNQLEANSKTQTEADANKVTGQTTPNSTTGGADLALSFPTFCGWAPQVCEAAQTVISFPTTLTDWWNTGKSKVESWAQSVSQSWAEAKEYFTKDRDSSNDQLDIPTPTAPTIDTTVNFSSACPPNITLASFSYHGFSQNWEVDISQFCSLLSTYVRPILITMGSFGAVLIVSGVRTNE